MGDVLKNANDGACCHNHRMDHASASSNTMQIKRNSVLMSMIDAGVPLEDLDVDIVVFLVLVFDCDRDAFVDVGADVDAAEAAARLFRLSSTFSLLC